MGSEMELSDELAKALQLDAQSHLFQQVFEKFTNAIKTEEQSIYFKSLSYDENDGYFSNKSSKSCGCHLVVFLTANALIIVPVMMVVVVVSLWLFKRNRRRNQVLRRRQIAQDRKEDVLEILKNYMNNSNQRWIPILPIRAQVMGVEKGKESDKEWMRVEKLVDKDANVQKSTQIVDGLQKLCWKLSDTALIG